MYWVRLFWLVLVSVQSLKNEHPAASECMYGIVEAEKPRPTLLQVRFSNEKITTWSYFVGGDAVEPQMPVEPLLRPEPFVPGELALPPRPVVPAEPAEPVVPAESLVP